MHKTPNPDSGRKTILIVDDESQIVELFSMICRKKGYRVIGASSPEHALELACREGRLDMLLSDVMMPGMNGYELAVSIKRCVASVAVLFVSGESDLDSWGGHPLGTYLLSKPVSPTMLLTTIRSMIGDPL